MHKVYGEKNWEPGTSCLVCSYSGLPRVKYFFQSHAIYECPLCGLLFLHPQPSSEELQKLYNSEEYFFNTRFYAGDNNYIFGYADYFAERFNKQRHFYRIARQCMAMLRESGQPEMAGRYRLLEVGCGPGFFLEVANEVGFDVEGIEFNENVLRRHSNKDRFPIRLADFENPGDQDLKSMDCVVMLDVIEHFRNPRAVINKVRKALRPGGLLVITTVDSGSIPSKILGRRLEDFRRMREHLYFFNRSNMITFLRQNGFSVCDVGSVGHTFSVDHLLNRIALMYSMHARRRKLFSDLGKVFKGASIYVNPHTKMIIFARKPVEKNELTILRTRRGLNTMRSSPGYYDYHLHYAKKHIQNKTVVELGSGNGNASEALLRNGARFVIGIERDPKLIRSAHERFRKLGMIENVAFSQLDIEKEISKFTQIIKENGIDTVFSFNFLEHVRRDVDLIRSLYEALPEGGQMISVVPSGDRIFGPLDEYYGHFRRYDIKDMRYRYRPFRLIYFQKCGLIRYCGWMMNKGNPNERLEKYWDVYISRFFGIDRKLDKVFGRFLPFGATLICVHQKKGPTRRFLRRPVE